MDTYSILLDDTHHLIPGTKNMHKRIIKILQDEGIDCLPNERFSLDVDIYPQTNGELSVPSIAIFEDPQPNQNGVLIEDHGKSLFHYFLDGAQRSYRVIEAIIHGKHYLPFCAGQVGVAVLKRRDDGRLMPIRELTTVINVLSIPNIICSDYAEEIGNKINKEFDKKHHFKIIRYNYSEKEDKDPGDLGRAMILDEMHKQELNTIRKMIQSNLINDQAMLAKDGGLQYRDSKIKDLNLTTDDIVQLRNVIGIAKTFNPNILLGKGRKGISLGSATRELQWKERSTVIKPPDYQNTTYGWWYLRIRPVERVYFPLQGVIKIEVFTEGQEKYDGISKNRADTISSYVLAERNVTPFKADSRWATHLYPIYLTETYLRSSFLSHTRFKSLIY